MTMLGVIGVIGVIGVTGFYTLTSHLKNQFKKFTPHCVVRIFDMLDNTEVFKKRQMNKNLFTTYLLHTKKTDVANPYVCWGFSHVYY